MYLLLWPMNFTATSLCSQLGVHIKIYIIFSVKPALYSVTYGIKTILFSLKSASIYDVMGNVFRH